MMGGVRGRIRCGGRPMTVIVLAGGRGRRMKADKAGLAIGGTTLLGRVLGQVGPRFDEVLVAAAPGQRLPRRAGARGCRVVRDETPGLGPIGGLLAGLRAARNEACAVVACDIPDIDLALLRALARAAAAAEIAVPAGPAGLYEPLFAVYRKSVAAEIDTQLRTGKRSLLPLFERCRTSVVRFEDPGRIPNLNTQKDYEAYLRSRAGRSAGGARTVTAPAGALGRRSGSGRRSRRPG